MQKDAEFMFKICIVGQMNTGKTSLLMRMVDKTFSETTDATLGTDFRSHIMKIDGHNIKLQIWDTNGQEKFQETITNSFYRHAKGVILCIDISNSESFETSDRNHAERWVEDIRGNLKQGTPILLVGTKVDLASERALEASKLSEWAKEKGLLGYMECSSKTGTGVTEIFTKIASEILSHLPQPESGNQPSQVNLSASTSRPRKKCTII